ncbi:hypothetical protein PENSPDRAFT_301087 [Peniophora sp. CONT]|nr:hypothetical protein PENSPDRAFT_301087 [Peniophora sp. CONT]
MSDVRGIDDFPPELLEKIFLSGLEYGGPRTRAPSSANLSHVCHKWRAIALACSRLWSINLPYGSLDWTKLCLSRCSSATLDVNVVHDVATMTDVVYQSAIELVLAHLDRTRSLRLHVKHGVGLKDVNVIVGVFLKAFGRALKGNTVSRLTSISIEADHYPSDGPALNEILGYIFTSFAPISTTRSVKFTGCELKDYERLSPRFMSQNIRELMLYDSNCWRHIDGAIACLQATPMLEILHIQNDVYHFDTTSTLLHAPRCAQLPNIREVILRGSWRENIALFHHIAIPPHAKLTIASNNDLYNDFDPSDSDMFARMADAFRQHFSAALSQGVHYEELRIHGGAEMLTFTVLPQFKTACPGAGPHYSNDILSEFLELSIPWTGEAETRQDLLNIFSTLPIFTLAHTLHLHPNIWVNYHPEIYAAYPHVRTLKIESTVEWFIDDYGAEHAAIFPELEHICFINIDFDFSEDDGLLLRVIEHLLAVYPALKSVEFRGCRVGDAAEWNTTRRRLGERGIELDHNE